jgi:putative transposase
LFGRLRVLAYCLMPNHVHWIVVPKTAEALAVGIAEVHRRHTRRVNLRQGWRGRLWQGRFASLVMDGSYLPAATRYVERNPVRAGLVKRAEDWPFSSAAAHVSGQADPVADPGAPGWLTDAIARWTCTWRQYLARPDEKLLVAGMHRCESTGRPLGEKPFLQRLSKALGLALVPKSPGRPRKDKK